MELDVQTENLEVVTQSLSKKERKALAKVEKEKQKKNRQKLLFRERFGFTKKSKEDLMEIILEDTVNNTFDYSQTNVKYSKELRYVVDLIDIKAILYGIVDQPIALKNGYANYFQILEVYGKDIVSLSESERLTTIAQYTQWLSGTMFDFNIHVTRLPTNTQTQIDELSRTLENVRYELLNPNLPERQRYQLQQRQDVLVSNIIQLEIVAAFQYNTEFFIWVFGDTLDELNSNVRVAQTLSTGFVPHHITVEKKESILKQYFNYNEAV